MIFFAGQMIDETKPQLLMQNEPAAVLGSIEVIEGTADMVTDANGAISFPTHGWRKIRLSSGLQAATMTLVVAEQGADDFVFVSREHLPNGTPIETAKRQVLQAVARNGDWSGALDGPKGLRSVRMTDYGASPRPPSYVHATR